MEFSRSKSLLALPVIALLNGCGGGGTDGTTTGGSRSSDAENAYDGSTSQATLTVGNRDRFLQQAFGNLGIQTLAQALAFEADLEDIRTDIAMGGETDYQETFACTPGTREVSAISNSNFSSFTINAEFADCDGSSVDLDGRLRAVINYNGAFLSGADKTSEDLTYNNLDILGGGNALRLKGEEEIDYIIASNIRELEKEVTITDAVPNPDRQTYYADVEVELDDDDQDWHLDAIDSLSGRIYDSVEGYVSLSKDDDSLVLTGASGTRIVVKYLGDDDVQITLYDGVDDDPVSTQTLTDNSFADLLNP